MKKFTLMLMLLCASCAYGQEWDLNQRIHPELREDLMRMIPAQNFDIVEWRKSLAPDMSALPEDEAIDIRDVMITPELRANVLTPKTDKSEYPALLYIHGGGHILGSPELYRALVLDVAKRAECIVVVPDYRLAPENPYPADADDCYTALKWMAGQKNIRADKIAVAGDSAGGGLTAGLALRARDMGGPKICFQMPLYPQLDDRNATVSISQINDPRVWNRDKNIFAWDLYCGKDRENLPYYAAPARAEDLSGLPPAYIMIGTLDPFRDEVITYAQRMMQAGVDVELHVIPGAFHGFEQFSGSNLAKKARNEYIDAIAKALN